ncbi:hypothetical protein JCM5296_002848 [Sporobolomyces johnsonii]
MSQPGKKRLLSEAAAALVPPAKQTKLAPLFQKDQPKDYQWLPSLKTGAEGPRAKGCGHFVWGEPKGASKIAAFDIDGTIIKPKSGASFPKDADDWKFLWPEVVSKIREASHSGYAVVLVSNQAGNDAQQRKFRDKLPNVCRKIGVPLHAFAAYDYDIHRKPGTGMWDAYIERFNEGIEVDYTQSYYVGDAAGRPEDHNDTDRKMAINCGLPFLTPEQYFHNKPAPTNWTLTGWDAASYDHSSPFHSPNSTPLLPRRLSEFDDLPPEVVLFVGSPGSGKTSFYKRHFAPKGYVHVNQDTLRTRDACLKAVRAALSSTPPASVVVDNTSPTAAVRAEYLTLVRSSFAELGVRVRCCFFEADKELCMHNSVYRASYDRVDSGNGKPRDLLPMVAFEMYRKNLEEPTLDEGFDEIKRIRFKFEGDADALRKWQRWLADVYQRPRAKKATAAKKK